MAIFTRSAFLYGHLIDETNFAIDFSEGGPILEASLTPGDYTLESFAVELSRALNDTGANDYTVTVNRADLTLTIAADAVFDLLVFTGPRNGVSAFPLAGFTGNADLTGLTSYDGDSQSGILYRPQFKLQDYVPLENLQGAQQANVNESASGQFQVVSFGSVRNMQCNIEFITDREQGKGAPIENNQNAVQEARDFLLYLIGKNKIEFFPNRDDFSLPQNLLLERTRRDRQGISFELEELISRNLPDYYQTGVLTFREIGI